MTFKTSQKKSSPGVYIKGALALSLFLLLLGTGYFWDVISSFHPDQIQIALSKSGPWAPFLFMFIMALAVVISPIPSLPLAVTAGAFFGPLLGTLYSVIGASLGAVASFLIARFLGEKYIERFIGGHISVCTQCSDKFLTKLIFLSRLLPFISFDIISYGAGLTKISLKNFSLATFLGMLPLTFIYNYFGAFLLLGGGLPFLLGLLVVFLFFLLPKWIERYNLFSLRQFFQHSEKGKEEVIKGDR